MKIPIPPWLIKFALSIADLESIGDTSKPDMRMYEYSWAIGQLAKFPSGKLLDIGCTASLNMIPATFCELGWQVWGLDIREFQYQHDRFHYISDIRQLPSDIKFDVVTAISSLEHFGISGRYGIRSTDECIPRAMVLNTISFLGDDGVFLVTVPYTRKASYVRDSMRIYNVVALLRLLNPLRIIEHKIVGEGEDMTIMVKAVK